MAALVILASGKLGRCLHPLLLRLSWHGPGQWLSRLRPYYLFVSWHPEGHSVPSITRLVLRSGDSNTVALLLPPRFCQPFGRCRLVSMSVLHKSPVVVMQCGLLGEERREAGSSSNSSHNSLALTLQLSCFPMVRLASWVWFGLVGL